MIATRRLPLAAAALSLAVATACGSELSSSPGTGLAPTTAPTTTSPVSTTPETTGAPTTAPTPAPPTTPTTAAPDTLPPGPAAVTTPFFVDGGDGGWLELGAWRRDRWVEADAAGTTGIEVEPGTTLTITRLAGEQTATAGAPAEACFDGRRGPTLDPDPAPPEPPGFGYGALAMLPPSWPLVPRPVVETDAAAAAYQDLGEAAFAGDPVDASAGRVEQTVIADLDGDGDDEAVVAFERVAQPGTPGSPGDVSALVLVDADTRAATTLLSEFVASTAEGPFAGLITQFRVIDVSDLNGDGRMEIVVHAWYYEGASVAVFEVDGDEAELVMANGCGA